jgi:hypothetical protein
MSTSDEVHAETTFGLVGDPQASAPASAVMLRGDGSALRTTIDARETPLGRESAVSGAGVRLPLAPAIAEAMLPQSRNPGVSKTWPAWFAASGSRRLARRAAAALT